ncbi:MAG: type II toxin-antitoxin system PemK/MazF family toxin [Spirochaetes bacterium]|nr:MAG: type II toxin-antitoxin system PemK/MazF family toxin [Spirochaetota bacterium]
MTRGEIWWADFGIPFGSEPGFRRPVLIVQDDAFNKSKINTIIVIPLTTNLFLENAPGNVFVDKEESGLSKDSVLVISQLSVIEKKRLLEQVHKVQKHIMEDVEDGIKLILGIQ